MRTILIAIVSHGKYRVSYSVADFCLKALADKRYKKGIFSLNQLAMLNKNAASHCCLENQFDYLLLINGDCLLPDFDLLELMQHDADIVATPGARAGDISLMPGIALVRREVLSALEPPWFSFLYDDNGVTQTSDDANFSTKVRTGGFDIYTPMSLKCESINPFDLPQRTKRVTFNSHKAGDIMIGVLHIGYISIPTLYMLADITKYTDAKIEIGLFSDIPFISTRHLIVKDFLASDLEWCLFVDDDISDIPNPDLTKIISLDSDIAGITTLFLGAPLPDMSLLISTSIGLSDSLHNDFFEAALVGFGLTMVARKVLEHRDMRTPFACEKICDVDYDFCRKARKLGFRIQASNDICSQHIQANVIQIMQYGEGIKNGNGLVSMRDENEQFFIVHPDYPLVTKS